MIPGCRSDSTLAEEAARLLDRLRAEPLPAEPRAAAALRRATQAAFALLEQTSKLGGRPASGEAAEGAPESAAGSRCETSRCETSRCETTRHETTRHETGPQLAEAAARLLDRLRAEPLPAAARKAAALRMATRHAFLLVEEIGKMNAAPARPADPKETEKKDRPFFSFPGLERETGEDGDRLEFGSEDFRERLRRAVADARKYG